MQCVSWDKGILLHVLVECLQDSDSIHRFTHQPPRIETGETRVLTEGLRGPNITGALSLVVKPVVLYHRARTAASLHKKKMGRYLFWIWLGLGKYCTVSAKLRSREKEEKGCVIL